MKKYNQEKSCFFLYQISKFLLKSTSQELTMKGLISDHRDKNCCVESCVCFVSKLFHNIFLNCLFAGRFFMVRYSLSHWVAKVYRISDALCCYSLTQWTSCPNDVLHFFINSINKIFLSVPGYCRAVPKSYRSWLAYIFQFVF